MIDPTPEDYFISATEQREKARHNRREHGIDSVAEYHQREAIISALLSIAASLIEMQKRREGGLS